MSPRDNIIDMMHSAAATRRTRLSDASRGIVQECREIVLRALPSLLSGLFDKLDDALFEMADKSDRNALQTVYFDVMRDVRKSRVRIERRFVQDVAEGFDAFWRAKETSDPDPPLAHSDLSLVEDQDLEESLAVNNMVSKGESLYGRELYVLGERLSHLASGMPVSPHANPVGPWRLCSAFRDAVSMLDVDVPVKLVIYKLFDKQVMRYAGAIYDELNGYLAGAGVLPKLTPRSRQDTARAPARKPRPAPDRSEGDLPSSKPGPGPEADVFASLRELIGQRRSGGTEPAPEASAAGQEALPAVEPGELMETLSRLQQAGLAALQHQSVGAVASPGEIRSALTQELHLGAGPDAQRRLGELEDDILEVVSMMFELILEDPAIPDALKVPISRLQIPVLKVALIDPDFFRDGAHPARRLLNNLAEASVGWDGGRGGSDPLYEKIQSVVDRTLSEFHRDLNILAELDAEFAAFLEAEQRKAHAAEERASQVVRGREKLALAKSHVAAEIRRRLEAHPAAPQVVRDLLEEAWSDVMLLAYLRQGEESRSWKSAMRVVDDLLWSTEPKASFDDRQELLRLIPDLLRQLREGLSGISFDQHRMTTLLKELQGVHIACLRPGPGGTAGGAAEAPSAPAQGEGDRGAPAQDGAALERPVLEVGTWLEMDEPAGPRRVKLAWRSGVSELCVLVDRRGVKVADMEMTELGQRIRDGSVRVIADMQVPLMDRVLNALLERLQRASPEGGSFEA